MELYATCAFGLEKLVQEELKKLGVWVVKTEDGRITFRGDEMSLARANMWLRCADRILVKMAEFTAVTFDQLFDAVYAVEWEKFIGPNDAFPVSGSSVRSVLHSEPAVQSIVKKAIVKRLQAKHGVELLPESSNAVFQVMVKANKDVFVVGLNSSGESLHKRGYRTSSVLAPMKETLAAALVKLSGWGAGDGIKNYKLKIINDGVASQPLVQKHALVDLFCGSGTIPIEAAMVALNIAPGLTRQFAFQQWPWFDKKNGETARAEARKLAKLPHKEAAGENGGGELVNVVKLPIYGFDIDADAVKIAEENVGRAGIGRLNFKRADFMDLDFTKFENCTFICNPPYGERMEDTGRVRQLYRELGEKFAQTKNCSLYLITSDEMFPALFAEATHRQPDKNRKLFNGNIRCYLYQYEARGSVEAKK